MLFSGTNGSFMNTEDKTILLDESKFLDFRKKSKRISLKKQKKN